MVNSNSFYSTSNSFYSAFSPKLANFLQSQHQFHADCSLRMGLDWLVSFDSSEKGNLLSWIKRDDVQQNLKMSKKLSPREYNTISPLGSTVSSDLSWKPCIQSRKKESKFNNTLADSIVQVTILYLRAFFTLTNQLSVHY